MSYHHLPTWVTLAVIPREGRGYAAASRRYDRRSEITRRRECRAPTASRAGKHASQRCRSFLQIERKAQVERLQHLRRWCLTDVTACENGMQIGIGARILQRGKRHPLHRAVGIEPRLYHQR